VHVEDPATDEYLPIGHGRQAEAPGALYSPAAHGMQDEAPAELYDPAAQFWQT
jgi:hypothetical protein